MKNRPCRADVELEGVYALRDSQVRPAGMLTGSVTGRTLGENLDRWTHEHGELEFSRQDVIRPLEKPIKETGHLRYGPGVFLLSLVVSL